MSLFIPLVLPLLEYLVGLLGLLNESVPSGSVVVVLLLFYVDYLLSRLVLSRLCLVSKTMSLLNGNAVIYLMNFCSHLRLISRVNLALMGSWKLNLHVGVEA